MRLRLLILMLLACTVQAGEKWETFSVTIGTNATAQVTSAKPIIGAIQEVYIQNGTKSGMTNAVSLIAQPVIGTNLTTTVVYTNAACVANAVARPRILGTDTEGTALSALAVAEPIVCAGDTVTFIVTQASAVTGVTVNAYLKIKE